MTPTAVTAPSAVEAAVAAPATAATPPAVSTPATAVAATAVAATAPTVAAAARTLGNQARPAVRPDSVKAGDRRRRSRCGLRYGSATEEQRAGHGAGTQRTRCRAA